MARYTYITDPGHGYLSVPLSDLDRFGIIDQISSCSFMTDTRAYLEEDCDAGVFIQAANIGINDDSIRDTGNLGWAKCRSYARYDASKVKSFISAQIQREVIRRWNRK